jgi:hypothetical protein
MNTQLSKEDIEHLYNQLWNTKPIIQQLYTSEITSPDIHINTEDILYNITSKEITNKLSRIKTDTAAGPDGTRKNNINQATSKEIIRLLFNTILICGEPPNNWNMNRTTLILKDPNKIENYRPITIGPILCRLFWSILNDRIKKSIKFTSRQKGFLEESGCFNNIHILNEIIKHAKSRSSIAAVLLDVSKAFDTIPPGAIPDALRRKGATGTIRAAGEEIIYEYAHHH